MTSTIQNIESSPLEAIVKETILKAEGITFADFMEMALYHPEHGYYTSPRSRIGKEGDFFTSSSVHALFGRLIARQLNQMWELLGKGAFTLVEQGGGEGHLALDILDEIALSYPEFYRHLTCLMIEISADNRERQRQTLGQHLTDNRIEWITDSELTPFTGCFLSNELLDAFPVHLIEKRGGKLLEVYVVVTDGNIMEELRPASQEIHDHFSRIGIEPVEGNRAEVNLAASSWMQSVAAKLERGFVLTIDYGHPANELYSPLRRNGTLICYNKHQTSDNPYELVGEKDITTHIDFTNLIDIGRESGLEELLFRRQYQFLIGLGFIEEIIKMQAVEPDPQKQQALRMTLKNLIIPDGGMGDIFKVLIQGKSVGTPKLLGSRSLQDIDPTIFATAMM